MTTKLPEPQFTFLGRDAVRISKHEYRIFPRPFAKLKGWIYRLTGIGWGLSAVVYVSEGGSAKVTKAGIHIEQATCYASDLSDRQLEDITRSPGGAVIKSSRRGT